MRRALPPALLAALWLVTAQARAQTCTVRAERVELGSLELRPEVVARRVTVDVELRIALTGPIPRTALPLRVRWPIDAPASAWIALGLRDASGLDPAFFTLDSPEALESVRVAPAPGGARVVVGRYAVSGAAPRCSSLRIAEPDPAALQAVSVAADRRALRGPLRLHLAPSARSRSIEIGPHAEWDSALPLAASVLETRDGWVKLDIALGPGARVTGWAPQGAVIDGEREADMTAHDPRYGPRRSAATSSADCYVGPASFAPRARLFAQEDSRASFGTILDDDGIVVRDCGGARVEIIEAFGQELALGWVARASVASVGVMECGDLTLAQDSSTMRVLVSGSRRDDVAAGEEIVRVGDVTTPHAPNDRASRRRVDDVCRIYRSGARVVVESASGARELRAR